MLAALAVPASASAANASVNITDSAFVDTATNTSTSQILPGEQVTWTYANLIGHGVRIDGETTDTCTLGNSMTQGPCTRAFPVAGNYRYYDSSCVDYATCSMQGLIVVDGPPVAVASAAASAKRGESVSFDGSASSDPNGDAISSYQWDFGDGTTASGVQVAHTYAVAGHYTVTLVVADATGTGTTTLPIDIAIPDSDGDGVNDDLDKCAAISGRHRPAAR